MCNERVKNIGFTKIRQFFDMARGIEGIINLGLGELDFDTPVHIREAAKKALDDSFTRYTTNAGIIELREAISRKFKKENSIDADPKSEILVTCGAAEAICLVMQTVLNPGDEVLVSDPCFDMYQPNVLAAGGFPVSVPLREEEWFLMTHGEVEKRLSKRSKVVVLNTPNNPTGSVMSRSELEKFADLAVEHNLLVVSDEVYEKMVYDGAEHCSIGSLNGMKDRTVTINSFSKTYAMTGWRIGYLAADRQLVSQMIKIHRNFVTHACSITQKAALAALEGPQDFIEERVRELDKRRLLLVKGLNDIDGITCTMPKGAFYAFANVKGLEKKSEDLTRFLIEKARVLTVPGSGFGENGEGYLRFSYATEVNEINEALDRIEGALRS